MSTYSTALITGASSGLGEEFAKQLAGKVDKLVLVARRTDRLEATAQALRESHPNMAVMVHSADLSKANERSSLVSQLQATGFMPEILINNAGLGDYGEFVSADWTALEAMLKVNIEAVTHLSHLIAPEMSRKGSGAILNVSSLASTLPIPDFAVYAATKAYVSSFSEALRIELQGDGIKVMALCPGPVKTEFGEVARREGKEAGMPPAHKSFYVAKEQVVREGLEGLFGGKARVFPGMQVAAAGLLIGAIPLVLLRQILKYRPRR